MNFTGAYVIVSHKPFFLDQVTDVTWELTPDALKVYGGNFSQYREQKQIELEAALRSLKVQTLLMRPSSTFPPQWQ